MEKRGQVTIFIIIAIVIIALGILIYLFFPTIQTGLGISTNNPQIFIQNCMEEEITNTVDVLSSQGGSFDPKNYFLYQDEKIEYLCYTSEYYIPCVMQQPMLKKHIENEIKKEINNEKKECLDSLRKNFESLGYDVSLTEGETKVELLPNRISVKFENDLTLTKDDSERYDELSVIVNNNLYELTSITNSILNMEARYGDSETTIYMNYYHDLKVEKKKQTDGTTIYILTNRDKGDKFQFASRSIAWPPGISK
tara:strand:+ start:9099 stop:9857 length:759 start_codon:yes stop_codon:yes gene_type:complete